MGSCWRQINGGYTWQSDVWNGRPTYKQASKTSALYLYYHTEKSGWAIGDYIGALYPVAYCEDPAATPDKADSNAWCVLDAEHNYVRGKDIAPDGEFVQDLNVYCSQTSMLQLLKSAPSAGKSPRAQKIMTLLGSHAALDKSLESAMQCAQRLHSLLEPELFQELFGNIRDIGKVNYLYLDSLVQARSIDENFEQPIAELVSSMLNNLKEPYAKYCVGLGGRIAKLKDLFESKPLYREAISRPEKLFTALEAPFLHVQRYPHFIQSIMMASRAPGSPRGAMQDVTDLVDVWNGHKLLATQILAAVGAQATKTAEHDGTQELPDIAVVTSPRQAIGAFTEVAVSASSTKGSYGMRFKHNPVGMFVHHVKPGGAASAHDSIVAGMRVVEINGMSTDQMDKQQRLALFKQPRVQMKIVYDPNGLLAGEAMSFPWYHSLISRSETKALLYMQEKGTYLVRQCDDKPQTFELAVAHKGEATFFEITREPDGQVSITNFFYTVEETPTTLDGVVDAILNNAVENWPYALRSFVKRGTKPSKPIGPGGRGRGRGRGRGGRGRGGRGGAVEAAPPQAEEAAAAQTEQPAAADATPVQVKAPPTDEPIRTTINADGQSKIGLVIAGPKEPNGKGCYIKIVREGSLAAESGALREGQKLLELGGQDARGMLKAEVNQFFKTASDVFEVVVKYDPLGYAAYDGGALLQKPSDKQDTGNDTYGIVQPFISRGGDGKNPDSDATISRHASVSEQTVDVYQQMAPSSEPSAAGATPAGDLSAYAAMAPSFSVAVVLPMGMSFDGFADVGCYVTKLKPGGNAEQTGQIQPGQQIISVNGKKIAGLEKKDVTAMIKASAGECKLELANNATGFETYMAKKSGGVVPAPPPRAAPQQPVQSSSPPKAAKAPTDPAKLKAKAKKQLTKKLGRDPTEQELAKKVKQLEKKQAAKAAEAAAGGATGVGAGAGDSEVDMSVWFIPAATKEQVAAWFKDPKYPVGTYLARNSSRPGKLAFCVKDYNGSVKSFLIPTTPDGGFVAQGQTYRSLPGAVNAFKGQPIPSAGSLKSSALLSLLVCFNVCSEAPLANKILVSALLTCTNVKCSADKPGSTFQVMSPFPGP